MTHETCEARAKALFLEGYSCAQSVFLTFAETRMDRETAARLASGFGGGLAGTRGTCGAVSGMALAYGLLRGCSAPADRAGKAAEYEAIRDMMAAFAQKNGSAVCRELLGLGADVTYQAPSARTAQYYKKRPCAELCACAAGILARWLDAHPE